MELQLKLTNIIRNQERRAVYRLCKLSGLEAKQARRMRDWEIKNVSRKIEAGTMAAKSYNGG